MKKFLVLAALLCAVGSAQAWCKNGASNYPECDHDIPPVKPPVVVPPVQPPPPTMPAAPAAPAQQQQQGQQQGQQATGGNGKGVGKANANNSVSAGNGDTRNIGIVVGIPPPVSIPALPGSTCPLANTSEYNSAYGPAFYSHGEGKTNTDNCAIVWFIDGLKNECRFESARRAEDEYGKHLLPKWVPARPAIDDEDNRDMSANECLQRKFKRWADSHPPVEKPKHQYGAINIITNKPQSCERKAAPKPKTRQYVWVCVRKKKS